MKLETWLDAELAAFEYARHNSMLERIEEDLKEFASGHRNEVGRERALGELLIGFAKVPAEVRVPADSIAFLESFGNGRFVRQKAEAKKGPLKNYLLAAGEATVEKFSAEGIVLVSGYEQFYLKLARHQRAVIKCSNGH